MESADNKLVHVGELEESALALDASDHTIDELALSKGGAILLLRRTLGFLLSHLDDRDSKNETVLSD